ncbi:group I truncated hemoglobin [Aliikangiella sp. IMCC44632]
MADLTLYNKIGGASAVEAAVHIFYQKFLEHPEITAYFEDIDMFRQEQKLRDFLTMVLKNVNSYSPQRIRDAHAPSVGNGLNDKHFDIFINIMEETLLELNIPEIYVEEFTYIAESFRKDVLLK